MFTSAKDEAAKREWITLLLQAKELGLTVEEIRSFIEASNNVSDYRRQA
ncbi:DNA-binding anti-repressor SinI [Paenibacillus rhizovicinus]|uniref:DNA-binding anti-repressor SinI n=1 Tax=Paenibacillus rhizovicinus TaxID=2704463 RepID=A0A6C0NZ41_9BACL|nr:anti-repressor SinI family protein [Paenibacillus rhizovicinus]QHW31520.1 DNA-binding anti-repressor SinI [Paenibacillus rhizovicinus]